MAIGMFDLAPTWKEEIYSLLTAGGVNIDYLRKITDIRFKEIQTELELAYKIGNTFQVMDKIVLDMKPVLKRKLERIESWNKSEEEFKKSIEPIKKIIEVKLPIPKKAIPIKKINLLIPVEKKKKEKQIKPERIKLSLSAPVPGGQTVKRGDKILYYPPRERNYDNETNTKIKRDYASRGEVITLKQANDIRLSGIEFKKEQKLKILLLKKKKLEIKELIKLRRQELKVYMNSSQNPFASINIDTANIVEFKTLTDMAYEFMASKPALTKAMERATVFKNKFLICGK